MDQFYRFVWQQNGYTVNISHEHAGVWIKQLAQSDYSAVHKTNCQKAMKMLFKRRAHERGGSLWEPDFNFSEDDSSQPRNYLTRSERTQIREAALEYGSRSSVAVGTCGRSEVESSE